MVEQKLKGSKLAQSNSRKETETRKNRVKLDFVEQQYSFSFSFDFLLTIFDYYQFHRELEKKKEYQIQSLTAGKKNMRGIGRSDSFTVFTRQSVTKCKLLLDFGYNVTNSEGTENPARKPSQGETKGQQSAFVLLIDAYFTNTPK